MRKLAEQIGFHYPFYWPGCDQAIGAPAIRIEEASQGQVLFFGAVIIVLNSCAGLEQLLVESLPMFVLTHTPERDDSGTMRFMIAPCLEGNYLGLPLGISVNFLVVTSDG